MFTWIDEFFRDIRFGIRSLVRSPGLSVIAILSLALGIMATTAIYSVLYGVVLEPFPYKDVDNLMSVRVYDPAQRGGRTGYSTDQFLEIAERSTIFEGVIASTISDVLWTGSGDPQRLRGNHGTANTFQVMGVPALVGRFYTPQDVLPGADPVVVLGHRFWERQFAGDPNVLGKQLRLNDQVRTVVGVMPKRFMWRGADVYVPLVLERGKVVEGVRGVHLLGRLKPGITPAQAEVDLRPIIADLKQKEPQQFPEKWQVGLVSFKQTFQSSISENIWILFGAVGLLLLIACANVSNLLLSKATSRQKEMAVRAALGARRGRLIRQLLTESLMLAMIGGILGVALAYIGVKAILTLVPPNTIPDESEVALNVPVLLFTLLIAVVTSIVFGLAPALHTVRRNLANPLNEAGRSLAGNARQALLRKGLVVVEVGLSLVLLVAASLMIRTLYKVQNIDIGFRTDRLLTMRVPLPEQRYAEAPRRVAFFDDVIRRVQAVPGVVSVGLNTGVHPLGGQGSLVQVAGNTQENTRTVVVHQINTGYTQTLGISLVEGRIFSESEVNGRHQLALVNRAFSRTHLDGASPVGRIVQVQRFKQPPFSIENDAFQVVGVVGDTLNRGITDEVMPEVYVPYTLFGRADRLVVLTQADPASMTNTIRSQVYAVDKDQPVTDVRTIDSVLQDGAFAGPKFNLVLFGVFGILGLTLAMIGVYGVMSNSIAQQTHEIGIRMALGASPSDIAGMILKRGFWLLLVGIAVGLVGSFLTVRLLARHLYHVSPFDPMSFGLVSIVLLLVGLQACLWPARRASRIDPIEALRQE